MPDGYTEGYSPHGQIADEAAKSRVVSWNHGDSSELAGSQEWVIVRLDGDPPGWDEDLGDFACREC